MPAPKRITCTDEELADMVASSSLADVARHFQVTIPAVRKRLIRAGLSQRFANDHSDVIPWAKKDARYQAAYQVRMLRLLGRKQKGLSLNEREASRLTAFLAVLDGDNELGKPLVITFDPVKGFGLDVRRTGEGYTRS